jgi:hypothetical protein
VSPPVIIVRVKRRGASGAAVRARRQAATERALAILLEMDASLEACDPEFAMEVHRAVALGVTFRMSKVTDPVRAGGVLDFANAQIRPAWVKPGHDPDEAERVFGKVVERG